MKVVLLAMLALCAGCASYTWRSSVPSGMRTVSVPTFRNETDVTELGAVAARPEAISGSGRERTESE